MKIIQPQTHLHTGSPSVSHCLPLVVKDLFNSSCLRKSAETALKVFQVIWLRCLPEAPDNGSFTFLWLESSSSPRPVKHQPQYEPPEAGREERAKRWDSRSSGLCLCRGRKTVCSNQYGVGGSKMSRWVAVCGYVCLWWRAKGIFWSFALFLLLRRQEEWPENQQTVNFFVLFCCAHFFAEQVF